MSEELKIINPYGDEIHLMPQNEYHLLNFGDVGGLEYNIVTSKGYLQRGISVTQKTLGSKLWGITIGITGTTETSYLSKRAALCRFFDGEYLSVDNLEMFKLQYSRTGLVPKEIEAHLRKGPSQASDPENRTSRFQRSMVTFMLPEPLWQDQEETSILLESQVDLFEFPIEFSDTFEFGQVSDGGVEINNTGDVSTPIIIEFEGLSTNPVIENLTYGEKLKLNKTLAAGDQIIMNTDYRNPRLVIVSSGVEENAFKYVDPTFNDFGITLRRGINEIKYSSDDTSRTTALLKYRRKWLSPYSGVIA